MKSNNKQNKKSPANTRGTCNSGARLKAQ